MISEKLLDIQTKLKAPKGQRNTFGNYNYRSCEDILESVKPLLKENGLVLTLSDELLNIGERYYVKATATLSDGTESIVTTAFAREEEVKKGMDGSQITGASSSYARKYALNGLFAIDDTKDSDATNTGNTSGETSFVSKASKELAKTWNINLEKLAGYLKKELNQLTDNDIKEAVKQKQNAIQAKQSGAKVNG